LEVSIQEQTDYPFGNRIRLLISPDQSVEFPLKLRIPGWCTAPQLKVNGEKADFAEQDGMILLERRWQEGDLVELEFPMEVRLSRWVENAVAVERGPLLYALRIREEWTKENAQDKYGEYYEVRPLDPWNYGLLEAVVRDPGWGFELVENNWEGSYPWNLEHAPLALRTKGKQIPDWTLYREMAGPLPHSLPPSHLLKEKAEDILLVPYGCTTLRITEFPIVR
jgi:hypothetical protein